MDVDLREENADGTSIIVELQDDVYLTVNPPKASGKRITLETIRQQLIDKQVSSPIDFEMVKNAVERCSGEPIKISSVVGENVRLPEIPPQEEQLVPPQDRRAVRQVPVRKTKNISNIAGNIKEILGIGGIDITISEDEMEAYITVHSLPKKNKVVYIIEQLKKKGVVYGIDEGKIFKIGNFINDFKI